MKKKVALITGITGQTGSYLAELLLKKKYKVHGIVRRASLINTHRIDHIYENKNFKLHYGDLTDPLGLNNLINNIKPDEIYNLAAQSHVSVSFQIPEYTTDVNAMGCLRILEIIKQSKKKIKFYQAREAFGIFACNGILFNHESPRRGETFITRKITIGLAKILNGKMKTLEVGNLNSMRDWGHAREYAEMQWLMLQSKLAKDYVISTGKQYTIKNFIDICFKYLGLKVKWKGNGISKRAIASTTSKKYKIKKDQIIIKVSKKYFRPTEVNNLLGDSSKAKRELGWKNKTTINTLIAEMIENDLKIYSKK